jgi:hypothetical protein
MSSWLTVLAWISVLSGIGTALVVARDVRAHPQSMKVMNIVWPVTGLYMPVVGWLAYRAMGRGMHQHGMRRPAWQGVFVSATHCGSGCAIGDFVGAPIVALTGLTLWGARLYGEYIVEFVLAYIFGIAFQYLPIRGMSEVSRARALVQAMKADTLALVAYQVGMFGWMAIMWFVLMPANRPDATSIVFWFMMQIGMMLGFLTTYPANWLLVRAGVKHAM